jgi:hypothetical protein
MFLWKMIFLSWSDFCELISHFNVSISLALGDRLDAAQNQAENRIGHALVQSFCMVFLPFDAEKTQKRPYSSTLKVDHFTGLSLKVAAVQVNTNLSPEN